jgi:hypothetical protein
LLPVRTQPASGLKKCIALIGSGSTLTVGCEGARPPAQFMPMTSPTISASMMPANTGVGFLRVVATSRGIKP